MWATGHVIPTQKIFENDNDSQNTLFSFVCPWGEKLL